MGGVSKGTKTLMKATDSYSYREFNSSFLKLEVFFQS